MKALELPNLPLSDYRPDFLKSLGPEPLLLEAEPGAGKSTLAPLWALEAAPEGRQVWVVQPRILAARGVARRLAELLGEGVGQTVGYQVPFDRKVSGQTQLVVMTPGVFLQRLLSDPELEGVATVMLDEVHERALDQDTAWALLQEAAVLREDLVLVLMSATPDPALQTQVEQRLFAPGRCFPVSVDYRAPKLDARQRPEPLELQVANALGSVSDWRSRTVLVFLPGWRAIEACGQRLARENSQVVRLHSRVSDAEQARALEPASGPRVILATNIAETSLTIGDVTLVIDSGLARRSVYEQGTGVSRLQTRRISAASAEQRRGRAGRVQAGDCLRLWAQSEVLAPADQPEIRSTDLVPLALRLAHWGSPSEDLPWLEPPNPMALAAAREQLRAWGHLDETGGITERGRQVVALGTHPRIAALLQAAAACEHLPEEALLLALALHFDALELDDWQRGADRELARNRLWQKQASRWSKALDVSTQKGPPLARDVLAHVFRDRIGHRQSSGRYRLNSGISVAPEGTLDSEWAVFPEVIARGKGHAGLGWSLSLGPEQQRALSQASSELTLSGRGWQWRTLWRMGGSITAEDRAPVSGDALVAALISDIQAKGEGVYPWPEAATQLLRRARLARDAALLELPELGEGALTARLEEWLGPYLSERVRPDALPWLDGLQFYLGFDNVLALDRLLPRKVTLPSDREVPVEYPEQGMAEVSGKLQEFFGCERFTLAEGRVPLRLHLASPNGSPLAITTDLASFWQGAYQGVRKEMRGRYPKHPWPEDPLSHPPTRLTKKRLAQG
ncbi:ATP-dependent helicase HrpB [Marinimicrobium agarilyticum]|uniref:ATP-dependent helicase HrpB n=1 Tax=Marinimicrobium agarilyticum TaxID=306546 RepID=UPI000565968B|nr:ATP-dependent helicase HrpB [Marinimicrobium agarilyticum]